MGQINWTIPPIWTDETVFIIGGGPSVNEAPLHLIYERRVIGVNSAFELGSWIDVCWFGDMRWFEWNAKKLRYFGGLKLTCANSAFPKGECWPGVHHVKRENKRGIWSRTPNKVYWNNNSGASAINLAYHLGAKKIVLIGFDMKMVNGEHNYHNSHKPHHTPKSNIYQERFIPRFNVIKQDATRLGLQIINTSMNSALEVFDKVRLENALDT